MLLLQQGLYQLTVNEVSLLLPPPSPRPSGNLCASVSAFAPPRLTHMLEQHRVYVTSDKLNLLCI